MPRFCTEKFSSLEPVETFCEHIASKTPFLDQHLWGTFDAVEKASFNFKSLDDWKNLFNSIFDPSKQWFMLSLHVLVIFVSFCLGLLYDKFRIRQLLVQKADWEEKERLLMQQLWAALEEKLVVKKDLEQAKDTLETSKRDLESERSDKDNIRTKCWGLERNLKIIQSERDILEEKIREIWKNSASLSSKNGADGDQKMDEGDLKACMKRVHDLQSLVKDLLHTHKNEKTNLINALSKSTPI